MTFHPGWAGRLKAASLVAALSVLAAIPARAVDIARYDRGTPVLTDIWVDRLNGNDANSGASRGQAVRTVGEAWGRIPMGAALTGTGYRIQLAAGTYTADELPVYWESRHGTAQFPVVLNSADGTGAAILPALNVYDARYFYLDGVTLREGGGDVFHCERCDHLLLSHVTVTGIAAGNGEYGVQETVKINQSQYVHIEDSDISGAWDNALDMVAVQYGHILYNRFHHAGDWCQYAKGGSAYLVVAGNEYHDCGTGGFTAGQGTGFEFMTSPWLHYEAYGIQFVNNLIHDVEGAAFGVNGGYNILMAYNTAYRIGTRSHLFEAVYGHRSCDGDAATCEANRLAGGWGRGVLGDAGDNLIPNRKVYVYNNLFYNPAGIASQWQHLEVQAPTTPVAGSNIPNPTLTDDGLSLRGNVIWNGPADHPLGIGEGTGCAGGNPTCNTAQLLADNRINLFEPELAQPSAGDFTPASGGALSAWSAIAVPAFDWSDRPSTPAVPAWTTDNNVTIDARGLARENPSTVGAYVDSNPFDLTVTLSGPGWVTSAPAGIHCGGDCTGTYSAGTPVTLTATPRGGFAFAGWSGACAGTSATCVLTSNATSTVAAAFSPVAGGRRGHR